MIKNKKRTNRQSTKIVVGVGPISGPLGPEMGPRLPLKVRLGQQAAGAAKAAQQILKPPVSGPVVFLAAKEITQILMSDTIPHIAKGFAKGGMDGVRAELLAEYSKQPHGLNDPYYQKALKVALKASMKHLPNEHRHHVATEIKKSCGEDLLNKVRDEFPEVPKNPDIPFYFYYFVSKFLNWALVCFVLFFLLEAYFLGVQQFTESYKNRGQLSDDEFIIDYFSKDFYFFKPLAFDYNSKNFVLNSCFIADDIYLLNTDTNFPCE